MLSCCCSWGGAVLFWRLRAGEGTVGLLSVLHHEKCCAALCGGEQTGWRWWRWWWWMGLNPCCWWQRVDVHIYHHPSLLFHGTLSSLLRVCIIPYKISPLWFPHNTYCFSHIACDNYNVHALSLSLSLVWIFPSEIPPTSFSSGYIQTPGPLVIIIHPPFLSLSDLLSIPIFLLSMYIQSLPLFVLLPLHHSVLSLSRTLLKSCRQEQKGTKLSQRASHWLLVDFSFKFIFKQQHLFILNRWEYISRHYNANDGTHIFLRIVVVGVGVRVCRQNASLCVDVFVCVPLSQIQG